MPNGHYEIPLKDAQTALSIIHKRAREWKINKKKIGIMGFSAGGHLASTVGTHFKTKAERPAFMLLAYPVVTMNKDLTHKGSRDNLLGKNPSDELVKLYSNELQVNKQTPPTFIIHARDDGAVPIANSENLLEALQKNKVPAKLVTYDKGGHGFGMRKKRNTRGKLATRNEILVDRKEIDIKIIVNNRPFTCLKKNYPKQQNC